MNNPLDRPVNDPKRFVKSVFDLAYGAQDGTETLSKDEVTQSLLESGIDPEAAWKSLQLLADPPAVQKTLQSFRAERIAHQPPDLFASAPPAGEAIVEGIKKLLALLGTTGAAGVFGRNWEKSPPDDLIAIYEQLKRQAERGRKK